ncbi:MAG TPA: bifunctional phosphoglucose/phosphomannose isomerase [Dehalococcoidia bacterium]|nr:bifunctional phosphoglucose/phosphomannose isomerase [Dehalococcoidia bacterium]
MVDLDNPEIFKKPGVEEILGHLKHFPLQCRKAWEQAMRLELPQDYRDIDKVIVLGIGGSAIGGEIASRLVTEESKTPVWVHREYGLPVIPDEKTLVIASSYSGNTEETLCGFIQSMDTPAKKLTITTGGKLKQLAEEKGIPSFVIDYKSPPRMAFPHSFVPLVVIFQKLGLLGDKAADNKEMLGILEGLRAEYAESSPLASNRAKQLAASLYGRVAVIYGGGILSAVARRWKAQFNENGKSWAFFELLPELNHNASVGYRFPLEIKDRMFVILLYSNLINTRIRRHYEASNALLVQEGIEHESIEARGVSALSHIISLVYLGDYLTCYLAVLNETDPATLDAVDFVKSYLARYID